MEMHLLDAFAAHNAGMTLDEFTRAQRAPATRVVHRARTRRHRAAVALSTTLGVAAPALTAVVLVTR